MSKSFYVVSKDNCPQCERFISEARAAGANVEVDKIGSDIQMSELLIKVSQFGGSAPRSAPVVFAGTKDKTTGYIGEYVAAKQYLNS